MDEDLPKPPRQADDQAGTVQILISSIPLVLASYWISQGPSNSASFDYSDPRLIASASAGALAVAIYWLVEARNYGHFPWRLTGFIPIAMTAGFPIMIATLFIAGLPHWIAYIAAFLCGVGAFACIASLTAYPPRRVHLAGILLVLAGLIQFAMMLARPFVNPPGLLEGSGLMAFCVTAFGMTAFAWIRLKRQAYELWVESWTRIMYKVRGAGPGMTSVPIKGPLLIVANHACWWDPLFVAGVLPRPTTPMMTSSFYDIWHLKPFMQHVIRAIRVPEKAVRHDAPEIIEAISALKRGECVVIFAEGYLRRKEEVPLRRFGRGVYEILKGVPDTPVIAGWVEGSWGSWCSWKGGPPTKNKRIDFRRRIDVSLSSPFTVPFPLLENHLHTRVFLMNAVSGARRHLGLESLPEFTLNMNDDADETSK